MVQTRAGAGHRRRTAPAIAVSLVGTLVLAALLTLPVPAARAPSAPPPRWIVQLRDPPAGGPHAAAAAGPRPGVGGLSGAGAEHRRLSERLEREAAGASVERTYSGALNGLAVRMTAAAARAVGTWPEVLAVTPDLPYHLGTYATPAQIHAPEAWTAAGGPEHAGEGVKIAVVDTGVYATRDAGGTYAGNPCFDDAGYAPVAGYPRGDVRFTNNKVLVARAYFRPGDPPAPGDDTPLPGPRASGHGTHVAATAACNAGTQATTSAGVVTIGGVAPRARILSYRTFYPTGRNDFADGNAYTAELVAAVDDAVRDGADVIVGSWGSTYRNALGWSDPMVRAVEAAADAGVVVVMAMGNGGPETGTLESPALSPRVVAVGAVTRTSALEPGSGQGAGPVVHPVPGNAVTGFSGRGPGPDGVLKPDVVAPGVEVVSAGLGDGGYPASLRGFGPSTGTSMAAPHVAGAAALLRELHPAWTPARVRSALMSTADDAFLDGAHTHRAGVLDGGAGLVDAGAAAGARLTLDPPSLGAPLIRPGTEVHAGVAVLDAGGGAGTWDVTIEADPGAGLSVSPPRIEVPADGSVSLEVDIRVPSATPPGDLGGRVVLTQRPDGHRLHLPLWVSVTRDPAVDVLLLDGDGSTDTSSLTDYEPRYRQALDAIGRSHRTVDLAREQVPSVERLREFRAVLLFTGDRGAEGPVPAGGQDRLARWLDEGGRIWVAGQNTAEALDVDSQPSPALGRSRLYNGFLGLSFATGSLWDAPAPHPSLEGAGPFEGVRVDLGSQPGAAPAPSVEGATPVGDTDTFAAASGTVPLLAPAGPAAPARPWAGIGRASEPGPGQPRPLFRYRAVWTGFGLENVTGASGTAGPGDLARRVLDWLLD